MGLAPLARPHAVEGAAAAASPPPDPEPLPEARPDAGPAGPRASPGWTCAPGPKPPCLMEQPVTFKQWRKIATQKELAWDTGTSATAAAVYLPQEVCQTHCRRQGLRLPTAEELGGLPPATVSRTRDPLYEWTSSRAGKGRWRICAGARCRKQAGVERQTDIGFRCAADRVVE